MVEETIVQLVFVFKVVQLSFLTRSNVFAHILYAVTKVCCVYITTKKPTQFFIFYFFLKGMKHAYMYVLYTHTHSFRKTGVCLGFILLPDQNPALLLHSAAHFINRKSKFSES